ncbi:MAG TPA: hypothetical protein VMT81_02595 [Candidatus Paceibacterota bacterium]|nr:hypothetical protein [Candidatus Paceibacterota bacterium]
MEKQKWRFWVEVVAVCAVIAALVLAVEFFLQGGSGGKVALAPGDAGPLPAAAPLPDGDTVVKDSAAGYYFAVPANWYVENTTVYPDYDPSAGSASPECKIELSMLSPAAGSDLGGWLTDYLHADPTAEVAELSRRNLTVGGAPAIEWQGRVDHATATLGYIALSGGVLEVAPSLLSGTGITEADDCYLPFEAVFNGIHIGQYEK